MIKSTENDCAENYVNILVQVITKLVSSPEYNTGKSANCKKILANLVAIKEAIEMNKSAPATMRYASKLVISLKEIANHLHVDNAVRIKSISSRSLTMWKAFHRFTTTQTFRDEWKSFLSSLNIHDTLYVIAQHTAHVVLEHLIGNLVSLQTIPDAESSSANTTFTSEEDNAIHFACGFIVKSLKKSFQIVNYIYKF